MPRPKQRDAGASVLEGRRRGANTGLHFAFWGGRIVVGPDWKNVLGTTFLIAAPVGIFFGFEAKPIGESISWAVIAVVGFLSLASLAFLACTAFIDPGFIPRDAKTEEPDDAHMTKEHTVNGYTVVSKWCSTCNHYRPPRCSHCAVCDNCVKKFDHHCPWVGNCVGERNYPYFLLFLFTTTALDCIVFAFSWVRLSYMVNHDGLSWKTAVKHEPANVALMIYTFFLFFFVGGLTVLHTYFTTQNITTYEHFRSRYSDQGNPYDRGLFRNWYTVCCKASSKRLPETLPYRKVEDPMLDNEGRAGFGGNQLNVNPNGHHLNGGLELAMMEEGRASPVAPSTASTLDGSSISDDDRSALSQRRIPLVGNFGMHGRNLLDTSESEFSEADHIRSHHSVVVLHDDSTAGSVVSAPSLSGERRSFVEDNARMPDLQNTAEISEIQAEAPQHPVETPQHQAQTTQDPPRVSQEDNLTTPVPPFKASASNTAQVNNGREQATDEVSRSTGPMGQHSSNAALLNEEGSTRVPDAVIEAQSNPTQTLQGYTNRPGRSWLMTKEEYDRSLTSDPGYVKELSAPVNNMPESGLDRVAPTPGASNTAQVNNGREPPINEVSRSTGPGVQRVSNAVLMNGEGLTRAPDALTEAQLNPTQTLPGFTNRPGRSWLMTKEEFEKSLASDPGSVKELSASVNNKPESRLEDRVAPAPDLSYVSQQQPQGGQANENALQAASPERVPKEVESPETLQEEKIEQIDIPKAHPIEITSGKCLPLQHRIMLSLGSLFSKRSKANAQA